MAIIVLKHVAPSRNPRLENLQLRPPNGSQDIAHSIIVTNLGVLVVRHGLPGLSRQLTSVSDQPLVVGDEHSAARRCYNLVPVEGIGSKQTEGAGSFSFVRRSEGFRRILDQNDFVPSARIQNRIKVSALPI